jgi:hypothetical protein
MSATWSDPSPETRRLRALADDLSYALAQIYLTPTRSTSDGMAVRRMLRIARVGLDRVEVTADVPILMEKLHEL